MTEGSVRLFVAEFDSAEADHDGYVLGNDIVRAVYLKGLTQSYFA